MGSFGLFFYGPYQHFWYRALDRTFPGRAVKSFLSKVVLNQLALAPLVISGIFAWNLLFQNQLNQLPAKVKQDFIPTLFNGWKFWVPAASVNFVLIPLPQQVLYMSCCGVLWTGYLSYSSSLSTADNSNGGGGGKNKKKNGGKKQ
jgi:protein Mpv17